MAMAIAMVMTLVMTMVMAKIKRIGAVVGASACVDEGEGKGACKGEW